MEGLNDRWENLNRVVEAAIRVLLRYPLCDRCLGRLFARLGRGLDNAERGRAIKTLLTMLADGTRLAEDELESLLSNIGRTPADESGPRLGHSGECYICGSRLDEVIRELGDEAVRLLKDAQSDISSFLVAVEAGSSYERREQEVIGVLGLDTWESVRREVKRLVGKHVSGRLQLTPSFNNPDVLVVLDLERRGVGLKFSPLLLKGRYVKMGRYISQMPWVRRDGSRKYKLSIYEVCHEALRPFGGSRLVLHIAGREDADARTLGDGRPLVLEVKDPLHRRPSGIDPRAFSIVSAPWIHVTVSGRTTREYVRAIKSRAAVKTYRVVVAVPEGITDEDVRKMLDLSNKVIQQRTPTRVLGRRKDVARRRRVYEVAARTLSKYLLEALVRADGGLYVKELVDGDGGRTTPSFSEAVGKRVRVVMLDVIRVEPPL